MTKPLRIAFFVHEFPALSETFVLNQAAGLLELGHDVTIFAERPRADPRIHPDVTRFGLLARTRYLHMPRSRPERILGAVPLFAGLLRHRSSAAFKSVWMPRFGRDALSLRLLYWTARLRHEKPFDVVHCHFGPIGQLAAKLREVGALSGLLGTVFHGVDISAYVRDNQDYYRYLFDHGDVFFPISEVWRQRLIALGCDPGRIIVHHMGVDAARYRFQPRHLEKDRTLRLLTVGRMVDKKGVQYAIRAVAALRRRGISVKYSLVGDGELRQRLARLVQKLDLTEHVTFYGWQDQEAVVRHMARNDVLIVPSVTGADGDQEGIPVTLMEAMASGMLVVATEHSGIPELVEKGRSGILVPERDTEELANALEELIAAPAKCIDMSHAARARVLEEFEIGKLNRSLAAIYGALRYGSKGTIAGAVERRPPAPEVSLARRA